MKGKLHGLPLSLRGLIGVFMLVQLGWISLLAFHTWQRQHEELENDLQLNARFLAATGKAVLDSVGYALVGFADRLVSESPEPLQSPLAATRELRFSQRLHERIGALTLLEPDGRIVAHSLFPSPATIPDAKANSERAERLARYRSSPTSFEVGSTEFNSSDNQWYVTLYQTHYRVDGRPHFILCAYMRIDAERPMWSNFDLQEKYAMTLLRSDGSIVARWPTPQPTQIYSAAANMPVTAYLAEQIRKSGEGFMHIPVSVDGKERLAGFAHLESSSLVAVASVDASRQYELWFSRNREWFISGGLFFGLTLGLFLYLTLLERRHHGELEEASHTDLLTNLLNRRGLFAHLDAATLPQADANGLPISLLYLDLDHFKEVNDRYGHDCGDELLRQCALRIRAAIRDKDLAARVGGDEFIVVLPETDQQAAATILSRLRDQFLPPFIIGERTLTMRPSIGATSSDEPCTSLDALISRADQAMYLEKCQRRENEQEAADAETEMATTEKV